MSLTRPHRLVVQDAGLSSRKQGFDSPWGYCRHYRPTPSVGLSFYKSQTA